MVERRRRSARRGQGVSRELSNNRQHALLAVVRLMMVQIGSMLGPSPQTPVERGRFSGVKSPNPAEGSFVSLTRCAVLYVGAGSVDAVLPGC